MYRFKRCIIYFAIAFTLAAGGVSFGAVQKHSQKKCPVREQEIRRYKSYVDYKGKRIYFCCKPCVPTFKEDPEKYMKKLKQWGEVLERAPRSRK
jgi:YHS domain-containing protein